MPREDLMLMMNYGLVDNDDNGIRRYGFDMIDTILLGPDKELDVTTPLIYISRVIEMHV
jgi:hypothetical protein